MLVPGTGPGKISIGTLFRTEHRQVVHHGPNGGQTLTIDQPSLTSTILVDVVPTTLRHTLIPLVTNRGAYFPPGNTI